MNSFNFPIRWQCSNIFGKILSGEARICFAVTFLLLFNLTYAKRKLLQIQHLINNTFATRTFTQRNEDDAILCKAIVA